MPSSYGERDGPEEIKMKFGRHNGAVAIQRAIMRDSLSERRLLAKTIAAIAIARKSMLQKSLMQVLVRLRQHQRGEDKGASSPMAAAPTT